MNKLDQEEREILEAFVSGNVKRSKDAAETQKLKDRLNEIYVRHTGQTLKKVEAALERDNFMSPEEAKAFGLIDEIVENRSKDDAED